MSSRELRDLFLEFFRERGHEIVPSSAVVPRGDPTLLFTNSGMNQFKNVFLGLENPGFRRAASAQKCIRASGKHNDLEDVGRDGRHHTFFEMLGNWSFGDYYKREAIEWGWEFVTGELGLPASRLWVSVYGTDRESYDVWRKKIGVPEKRIVRLGNLEKGDEENFWSMGETGPCGPCSEIHYDYGERKGGAAGGDVFSAGSAAGEIIELWNLVFMEFNRQADGRLVPLPSRHVDTGLGLERAAAILQGVRSNYDTDLFLPLTAKLEELSGVSSKDEGRLVSFRVVSDHIRSLAFAIADGAVPSNEGRGYVLRRILRRAVRHGRLLGLKKPFLSLLVGTLADVMGDPYRELREKRTLIEKVIASEEELFLRTLDRGMEEFGKTVRLLRDGGKRVFPGEEAFLLHDTYGFPLDLTEVMAAEEGLEVDREGFDREMGAQRERAQASSRFQLDLAQGEWVVFREEGKTGYTGYGSTELDGMLLVKYRPQGDRYLLVFDRTPFYGESGGQVGDTGSIEGAGVRIGVVDVRKTGDLTVHVGVLESGDLRDVPYRGVVEGRRRRMIMANHTATHLLHSALRSVLGAHVAQAGSIVLPDRLRFDFNHYAPLSAEELEKVERLVNEAILRNLPVSVFDDLPMEEAKSMGAIALFGEKYGKRVRMVRIGDLSTELCGGTHVRMTGEVGLFMLVKESSISAGVRRIEAVTGFEALDLVKRNEKILDDAARLLKTGFEGIPERIRGLQERIQSLERQLKSGRRKSVGETFDPARDVARAGSYSAALVRLEESGADEMREISDKVKAGLTMGLVLVASAQGGKVSFVCAATDDAVSSGVHCGNLLQKALAGTGGRGGGRPHLAQGAASVKGAESGSSIGGNAGTGGIPGSEGASSAEELIDGVFDRLKGELEGARPSGA